MLCVLALLNILLPDAFVLCYGKSELPISSEAQRFAVLRFLSAVTVPVITVAVNFNNRPVRNVAVFFTTVITIASVLSYETFIGYMTSPDGKGLNSVSVISDLIKTFFLNRTFRSVCIGIIWELELLISVIFALNEKYLPKADIKECCKTFALLIYALIKCTPIYVPQHIFGYTQIIFEAWSLPHIIWLVITFSELFALYFIFRNKELEIKRSMLVLLSLILTYQYSQMFGAVSISMKRMPFQLCNLAAFLILLSIVFNDEKLFAFTAIVNVAGVIFALAVPDLDGKGLFYLYNMHFVMEHTNILIVPILVMLFGLFPRFDKKALKSYFFGFLIYFSCVLVLGTTFNAIAKATGNGFWSANYLFIFDKAVAENLFAALGKLFTVTFTIGNCTFYPVAAISVYLVFNALCLAIYFAVRGIYKIEDAKKRSVIAVEEDGVYPDFE